MMRLMTSITYNADDASACGGGSCFRALAAGPAAASAAHAHHNKFCKERVVGAVAARAFLSCGNFCVFEHASTETHPCQLMGEYCYNLGMMVGGSCVWLRSFWNIPWSCMYRQHHWCKACFGGESDGACCLERMLHSVLSMQPCDYLTVSSSLYCVG
jgi:hypothetical protein